MLDSTALQDAVVEFYGRRPAARVFDAQVYSDIVIGGQSFLVDAGKIQIQLRLRLLTLPTLIILLAICADGLPMQLSSSHIQVPMYMRILCSL